MTRSMAALGVLLTACTMPNPAFEDGLDEAADTLDESTTRETGTTGESTSDATTLDTGTSDTSPSDTNPNDTGTSTDTDPSDTSTTDNTSCGNGIVENDEQCDDANQDNTDNCTTACTFPFCGDGFLQDGEACDDGNAINDDACTNVCMNAGCGDGIVQIGQEQCDDGNLAIGDGCNGACTLEFRIVFVTSTLHVGGEIGGLENADAICTEVAASANLTGKYQAWISAEGQSPQTRFVKSTVPYKTAVHHALVAMNWMDLVNGIANPISTTETGAPAPFTQATCSQKTAWTGTNDDGSGAVNQCGNFADPNAVGAIGNALGLMAWSNCAGEVSCQLALPIYCFQK